MPLGTQDEVAIVLMSPEDRDLKRVSSLLEKVGLHVMTASGGSAAVELARKAHRDYQTIRLVIVDEAASEPGMPGLIEGLREVDSSIRILLISERDEADAVPSWMAAANIRGFLNKPFRRSRFLAIVLSVIGKPLVRTA